MSAGGGRAPLRLSDPALGDDITLCRARDAHDRGRSATRSSRWKPQSPALVTVRRANSGSGIENPFAVIAFS